MATLYLIPNVLIAEASLNTITQEVADVIQIIDIYFVENVKNARRYLKRLGIKKPIDELQFFDLNIQTQEEAIYQYAKNVSKNNWQVGIISESGCPAIADPGAVLVRFAHEFNIKVKPLVGPSSILLALMASGMNGQSFAFNGYLPIDKIKRANEIKLFEQKALQTGQAQVFIETPYRNNALLADCLSNLKDKTRLCVANNITMPDEWIKSQSILNWKNTKEIDLHKKPSIFIIGA